MTPSQTPTLRELVELSLERAPAERATWLRGLIPNDERLRAEVLDIAARAESPTSAPLPFQAPAASALHPGDEVASYRIVRELGRGGMGTVYEAEQDVPRRRIALKVLAGGVGSPAVRTRFRYEVEVLGSLRHPGIAQLYEAGVGQTDTDAAWFAMEYVPGAKPITRFADERGLSTHERLALFLKVCDAVHYGHQQGVVHRDLKPDNLLIDESGHPKVIDFGVARAIQRDTLDATLRTQAGEIVGTLAYMSPEQINGAPVDTRSDLYALGVVLFELLTGDRPIQVPTGDLLTAARRIAEAPPARPRSIDPKLAPDLEVTLLHALEKQPAERYASVSDLAADIRRHLGGFPILARPPTRVHQMKLFARRNKTAVVAAGLVLAALLIASIVSVRAAIRADDQAEIARAERDRFQQLFETQFDQSMEAVGKHAHALLETLSGPPVAKQMLQGAVERLEGLERHAVGDPTVLRGLASAYLAIARITKSWGNPEAHVGPEVRRALERAHELITRLIEREPSSDALHNEGATVTRALFMDAALTGHPDLEHWRTGVTALLNDPRTSVRLRMELHWALATAAQVIEDYESRLKHLNAALEIGAETEIAALTERAQLMLQLGNTNQRMRRRSAAIDAFRKALSLFHQAAAEAPDQINRSANVVAAEYWLGDACMATANPTEAKALFESALTRANALQARAPDHFGVLLAKARALRGIGQITTSNALTGHAKGSQERLDGVRLATSYWTEALRIYDRISKAGRENKIISGNATNLRRAVAMNQRVLDGSKSHGPGGN